MKKVAIEDSWYDALHLEFEKPYFQKLTQFVKGEYKTKNIFPHPKDIFKAFDLCPFDNVKVVILGQDPYHGRGQAMGLSFSVKDGTPLPPSLKNIFKEIKTDIDITPYLHGDLSRWARQGVLLLNATLTVKEDIPGSHQKRGWEEFTDAVIKVLNEKKDNLVFILWGAHARKKGLHIDRQRHCVIESAHPSPFSAHEGFFGSKPFSRANQYLQSHNKTQIDWQ